MAYQWSQRTASSKSRDLLIDIAKAQSWEGLNQRSPRLSCDTASQVGSSQRFWELYREGNYLITSLAATPSSHFYEFLLCPHKLHDYRQHCSTTITNIFHYHHREGSMSLKDRLLLFLKKGAVKRMASYTYTIPGPLVNMATLGSPTSIHSSFLVFFSRLFGIVIHSCGLIWIIFNSVQAIAIFFK